MGIKKALKAIVKKVFTRESISTGMRILVEAILEDKKKGRIRRR